jgi:hypothetical protein
VNVMGHTVPAFGRPVHQVPTHKDPAKSLQRFETLGDAVYQVVHRSKEPAKALADRIGCRPAYLVAAADPMQTQSLPARLIVPLTLASGDTAIVRHLAEAVGGVFVELPKDLTGTHADVVNAIGRITAEMGEVMAATGRAMEDGRITADEATRAQEEAKDAIAALHQFIAVLDEVAK